MATDVMRLVGCLLAAVGLVTIFVLAPDGGGENNAVIKEMVSAKGQAGGLSPEVKSARSIWRMDYDFNNVGSVFCGGQKYWDEGTCSKEYEASVVMMALPLFVVSAFTLLLAISVYIGRYLCTCFGEGLFGGYLPSEGIFMGRLMPRDQGYDAFSRQIYIFSVIGIWVLVIIGMSVGLTGNSDIGDAVNSLLSTTEGISNNAYKQVTFVNSKITELQSESQEAQSNIDSFTWKEMKDGAQSMQESVKKIQSQVADKLDAVKKIDSSRAQILYWGFIVPPLICTIAVLGYFFPIVLTMVVPIVFLTTIVVWLAIGFSVSVMVMTADFCVALDDSLHKPNTTSPFNLILSAHSINTGASQLYHTSGDAASTSATDACTALHDHLCNQPAVTYTDKHGTTQTLHPVSCPTNITCSNETLQQYTSETVVRDFLWGCGNLQNGKIVVRSCGYTSKSDAQSKCLAKYGNSDATPCYPNTDANYLSVTIAECANNCTKEQYKNASAEVNLYEEMATGFDDIATRITPYKDTAFIDDAVTSLQKSLCWDMIDGTDYVLWGLCILGVVFFFANIVYLGAIKRFNRRYRKDEWWPKTHDLIMQDREQLAPLMGGAK